MKIAKKKAPTESETRAAGTPMANPQSGAGKLAAMASKEHDQGTKRTTGK